MVLLRPDKEREMAGCPDHLAEIVAMLRRLPREDLYRVLREVLPDEPDSSPSPPDREAGEYLSTGFELLRPDRYLDDTR